MAFLLRYYGSSNKALASRSKEIFTLTSLFSRIVVTNCLTLKALPYYLSLSSSSKAIISSLLNEFSESSSRLLLITTCSRFNLCSLNQGWPSRALAARRLVWSNSKQALRKSWHSGLTLGRLGSWISGSVAMWYMADMGARSK